MQNKISTIVLCCTLIAALLLSIFTMASPTPKNQDDWFSAERAFYQLEVIAKNQHSVFDLNEIEEVRDYLEETIATFPNVKRTRIAHGQIETVNQKNGKKELVDVNNIYAEIPGTSGASMLLMAHYDSSPYKVKYGVSSEGSFGAADNGYGVTTMLEIMRILNDYAAQKKPVNGVKFVFTDAEEVALGGSKALIGEYADWIKDVNIVINLEARGNKGPLYLFQTSDKNHKLIDFYSRSRLPFAFSIAADVYKHLPSDTDFTPFLNAGYTGLNFSTLNSLKYYHTPLDNLENADKATLQFYGEQVYPLVMEYIGKEQYSAPESFVSNSNAVFFTLLPGILVYYSQTASWILIVIITLCAFAIIFLAVRKKAISLKKMFFAFAIWMGYLLASVVAGLLLAKLIGIATGNPFSLTYMPNVPFDLGYMIIFTTLILAAGIFVAKLCRKLNYRDSETQGGAILLVILFNSVFAFLLHGSTYLFVFPAIFILTAFTSNLFFPSGKGWWKLTLYVLAILVISILYITLVYSLFLALSFGALAVILLFASLFGCMLASFKFTELP